MSSVSSLMAADGPEQLELPAPQFHAAAHRRRGVIFLGLASAAFGFAIMIQMGLDANFVAEEMKLAGFQQGLLAAIRESCGIFALAILAGLTVPRTVTSV